MSSNPTLYQKVVLKPNINPNAVTPKMYRGFSTVSPATENFNLYDFELIQQDILNNFYTRQGEKLMNPTYGCIIWDLLFEPLTPDTQSLITQNVNTIINLDPRISASQVIVTAYESGIQLECIITFLPYNVSSTMKLRFDQANGLLAA